MPKKSEVKISKEKYYDEVSSYDKMYNCPNCHNGLIRGDDNYCPECGVKIIWKD